MPSVTRTPACTVKGCPSPRDPDWHVPICGHGLEGHHHHVTKRSQGGKDGPQVFICPKCHDNIDNGEWGNAAKNIPGRGLVYWAWDLHGNTLIEKDLDSVLSAAAEGVSTDGTPSPRSELNLANSRIGSSAAAPSAGLGGEAATPPQVSPSPPTLAEDWKTLSDDELQELYETAEKRQGLSFLVKCKAVHSFKEKHDWGDAWTEHAYQRFGASRRTLYAYANIWAICVTSDTFIERIAPLTDSKSLMQAIGRRSLEDGVVAMEAAVAHYAEFGEAPTVSALAHKLGVEAESRPRHECPDCGAEHQVKS